MRTEWGCGVRPLLFDGDGIGQRTGISPVAGQDLKLIKPADYKELGQGTIELKRMLTGLIQKLNADG